MVQRLISDFTRDQMLAREFGISVEEYRSLMQRTKDAVRPGVVEVAKLKVEQGLADNPTKLRIAAKRMIKELFGNNLAA